MTTDNFNIFEGLEILKLIYRFIADICNLNTISKVGDEKQVHDEIINKLKIKGIDIILGVDDIVNPIIGKQESNISNVKLNLKMDSEFEKEFSLIQKDKEDKARYNIVKGIEEIEKLKKQNLYVNNSVSSEVNNNQSSNSIEISNKITSNTTPKRSTGLNLRDTLIQRLIEHQRADEARLSN